MTSSINAILLHQGSKTLLAYTVPALITPINLEREEYLSCQLCATFDPDRQVRSLSTATWQALSHLISPKDYLAEILDSITDSILESSGSTSSLEDKAKRKLSDEERIALQEEKDRKLNYLTTNIEAFTWSLQYYTDENTALFARVSSSDSFWSFLSSKSMDSAQVRRAVWRTLNTLLAQERTQSLAQDSLSTISEIAPKAAFSERDYQTQNTLWEPLISLFRLHPLIWKGAMTRSDEDSTNESGSSSGSESENSSNPAASSRLSQNIASFFDLLQVGFYGNAVSGYSATPLLVHTIPARIWPRTHDNLERLFTSFWGAYAGGAIDNASTVIFVKCLIDLVRLSLVSEEAAWVSSSQIVRLWEYYLHLAPPPSKYLSLSNQSTIEEMEKALISFHAKYPQIFGTIWASIAEMSKQNINRDAGAVRLAQGLAQLSSSSSEHISLRAQALLQECVILAASKENSDNSNNFILEALQHSGKEILQVAELHQVSCF